MLDPKNCDPNTVDAMIQQLEMICDVGFDYDGCESVDSLKNLVDDLVESATRGLQGIRPQYINSKQEVVERVFGAMSIVPEDRYNSVTLDYLNSSKEIKSRKARAPLDITVQKDGDAWMAFRSDFINLQESHAGFGATPSDAIKDLDKLDPVYYNL